MVLGMATLPSAAEEPLVPAALSMTATPDTLLVQGDDVTVTGSGATANSFVGIAQCLTGATTLDACLQLSGVGTSGSGNFATVVTPRRLMTISGVAHDCADVDTCELAAFAYEDGPPTILASAGIQFDPSVPPPPPPTLTGSPTTGLVQGDVVNLVGAGLGPNAGVGMIQCLATSTGSEGCDFSTVATTQTDGSGGFTYAFTPRRIIFAGGANHDCAVEACVIGAGEFTDQFFSSTLGIQFDPNVPPPPPPTITVTPSQGLQDGQVVTVSGVGFPPNQGVSVVQCGNPPENSGANCDLQNLGGVQVGADGTFSHQLTVHRMLKVQNNVTIDCTGSAVCSIGAGTGPGRGDDTPIGFAAATVSGGGAARAVTGTPNYAG